VFDGANTAVSRGDSFGLSLGRTQVATRVKRRVWTRMVSSSGRALLVNRHLMEWLDRRFEFWSIRDSRIDSKYSRAEWIALSSANGLSIAR
jgi:hypothetical protein